MMGQVGLILIHVGEIHLVLNYLQNFHVPFVSLDLLFYQAMIDNLF